MNLDDVAIHMTYREVLKKCIEENWDLVRQAYKANNNGVIHFTVSNRGEVSPSLVLQIAAELGIRYDE